MSSDEEICVLCCREIRFYATGFCEHPVCHECSTRMRVLCEQNECPICRSDMPLVIFTHRKTLFSEAPRYKSTNKKYTITFEDEEVEDAFSGLLQHICPCCGSAYMWFDALKNHVRSEHTLFYCDLCVKNLKIFTFERRCYSRKDLAHHKRKGDLDDTSHRGHPLCEFCDDRFLDFDELYRHLRREHYLCHFCDADGMPNLQFYHDYSSLEVHFRKQHYLCEEGDCAKEEFVGAFRSEIDYKAHVALNHTKNKTKAEVKQARTLDLEFHITPRKAHSGNSSPNYNEHRKNRHGPREVSDLRADVVDESQSFKQPPSKTFDTQCVQDFPLLVNGAASRGEEHFRESHRYSNCISNDNQQGKPPKAMPSQKRIQIEDFPSLPSANERGNKTRISKPPPPLKTFNHNATSHSASAVPSRHTTGVTPQTTKWGESAKENENEKSVTQNGRWSATTKKLNRLEEDFPKLETKERYSPAFRTEPQGDWSKRDPNSKPSRPTLNITAEDNNENVAQQIYQKCKSKKKQKNNPVNVKHTNHTTEPVQLTKLYSGFSNYDVMEDDDGQDSLKNLNLKIYNKIENRRREAEAEDVPWREKVHLMAEDFPPLAPPPAPANGPPKIIPASKAPPGFSSKAKVTKPPTSSVSLSSIAQQLTTTKDNPEKVYSYDPPADFDRRNGKLIQQIYEFVDSDNKLFDEFKSLSGNFRQSKISAAEYHSSCMRILGKGRFLQLFTELLCLLPDIKKQQELLAVHDTSLRQNSQNKGAMPKIRASMLAVCHTCYQVLVKSDFESHTSLH